ncbi:hypothetical protein BXZ70DRAFT_456460 [Cristinia sonorae]|uniref:Nephrocystin 3-like N-terminal domain-containing protein n=1 Tax=Cristinia sonorae TaxID=1940300 RepID=A0A8K0UIR8_9AGAR|nr:hypothetical protein BXZ70DRAFT_456460 [Cristinia sonorae]
MMVSRKRIVGHADLDVGLLNKYCDDKEGGTLLQLTLHGGSGSSEPRITGFILLAAARSQFKKSWSAADDLRVIGCPVPLRDTRHGLEELVAKLQALVHACASTKLSTSLDDIASVALGVSQHVCRLPLYPRSRDLDQHIHKLLSALETSYAFVAAVKHGAKSKETSNHIIALLRQTIECMVFIINYIGPDCDASEPSLVIDMVDAFIERLHLLQVSRWEQKTVADPLLTYRSPKSITDSVHEPFRRLLKRFRARIPDFDASTIPTPCTAGTASDKLREISSALLMPQCRILYLCGPQGSGKTAVASSLVNLLSGQARLMARFFGSRSSSLLILHHLVSQLVAFDTRLARHIGESLQAQPKILMEPFSHQFSALFVAPLRALPAEGPVVILLDGLDQCGADMRRELFHSTLREQLNLIPSFVRFFITTRLSSSELLSDVDIGGAADRKEVTLMDLSYSHEAVMSFLRGRLRDVGDHFWGVDFDPSWPALSDVRELAVRAKRHFLWAVIACDIVDGDDPASRLDQVLRLGQKCSIDDLFTWALNNAVKDEKTGEILKAFQDVFGVLLGAEHVLPRTTFDDIVSSMNPASRISSAAIVQRFPFAFTEVPYKYNHIVRIHPSFGDYLTNPSRCLDPTWRIDRHTYRHAMVIRFLSDLPSQIADYIGVYGVHKWIEMDQDSYIRHACRYWVDYLSGQSLRGDHAVGGLLLRFMLLSFHDWFALMSDSFGSRLKTLKFWLREVSFIATSDWPPHLMSTVIEVLEAYEELDRNLPANMDAGRYRLLPRWKKRCRSFPDLGAA